MTYKLFLRKILSLAVVTALAFSFTSVATAETDEKQTLASVDAVYSENVSTQKGNISETKYEQLVGDINSAFKDCKEKVDIEKYNLENKYRKCDSNK